MKRADIQDMREIGRWLDLSRYYVDKNGTAWSYSSCTCKLANLGPEQDFRATFSARFRGELYPQVRP